MPALPGKILVACPHCGHQQPEPRAAISTICKSCNEHFRLADARSPRRPVLAGGPVALRRVHCFECGAELQPPVSAHNTVCKSCSSYVDLRDYQITSAVSKNFRTAGQFVVEEKGYVLNAQVVAGDVVLKGRFLGQVKAGNSLTIFSSAEIQGGLCAHRLIVPSGQCFWWSRELEADWVEIEGDFIGVVRTAGSVRIGATGRLFGHVIAPNLVVENGGVWVGTAQVRAPAAEPPPGKAAPGKPRKS